MKLLGVCFVLLSAGSVGFQLAGELKRRCMLLRALLDALHVLQGEILYNATPLPQAFALMAASSKGAPAELFSGMAKEMDKRKWLTPLAALEGKLKEIPEFADNAEACDVLRVLMTGLGKYDQDSQQLSLKQAREGLEQSLAKAEQERSVRSKTFEVLGICAGLSLVILLI